MAQNGYVNGFNNSLPDLKKVTHVLFDLDGIILDSECIYDQVVSAICHKFGKTYPRDTRLKVLGTTEQKTAEIICKELELPISPEEFRVQMNVIGNDLFKTAKLMNGAKRLIEHLHESNVPIALATSSGKESVAAKTTNYRDLFDRFHHKVMGTTDPEVKFGKPHPEIYLICAGRFPEKPKPEDCLVIEDAPNGVTAGRAAGMQVVMVPDPALDKTLTKNATIVIDSLLDFQPELFGLPPFKN